MGQVTEYEDIYRYGYVRGPGGVIIGLVEEAPLNDCRPTLTR